ncbi:MAG: hypothetical protein ACOC6H_02745 [Thermoproteota archaeon]
MVSLAALVGSFIFLLDINFSLISWVEGAEGRGINYLYLLGFLVTIIGNGSFLFPIPYAAAIPVLASYLPTITPRVILGVVCGIAAGLGEMTAYGVGYLTRKRLSKESKQNLKYLKNKFDRSSPVLIFLVGLLPIPDEFIIVPLASAGYPFKKMVLFCTLGKTLLCISLSSIVGPIFGVFLQFHGESPLFTSLFAVAFILLFYFSLRIDWKEIF